MKEINNSIRCDVYSCTHNVNGCNCSLPSVKISTDCTDCTCCQSFHCKQDQ
ncbi:MAG: DUF1540 domain-containing protein [Clostridia bacterium]|nr:DUF1540 domain-containing protein [Clostridia bacterium]